ncbi:MAG: hypothetical protein B6I38_06330 [Anaerolineaceae bacterium 4572_5.1]|nr:MAG: hypothetical protein B6I38_06330 [Anaerolineaceae bacterium 4572_5.1]
MPPLVFDILDILGALLRLIGLLVFGLGLGWLTLEAFRKDSWQLQTAAFLGFVIAAVGMAKYVSAGSLGMFAAGAGAAMLMWGMKKDKQEDEDEE